jgi:hypothetical protein
MLLSSESKVDGVTPWAKQALNAGGPEGTIQDHQQ